MSRYDASYQAMIARGISSYEADIWDNVSTIRGHLDGDTSIEFHCYNKQEANDTSAKLTEEQRRHVRFFWLTFGGKS